VSGFLEDEPEDLSTGFWAYNPEAKARRSIIEMCLIIDSKYRKYERDCCKSKPNS
jgi:hypothetical protein